MPNYFAYAMLIAWPLIALKIYNKNPLERAVVLLFLVPYLILPQRTEIDLPLIPTLDKATIPALTAFYIFYKIRNDLPLLPDNVLIRRTIFLLFLFPVFTVMANGDTLRYGYRVFNGLGIMDIINICFTNFTYYFIPLIIGCQYLRSEKSHEIIIRCFAIAGLIYSIPVLWEIRMSPQLHSDIYGFFPHSFKQQARQGGFRAIVFLGHGLKIAIFMAITALSVFCLWKNKQKILGIPGALLAVYMLIVLVLSKSLGALVYVMVLLPFLYFMSKRIQLAIAASLVFVVLIFPGLRSFDVLPIEEVTSFFEDLDPDRAQSLQFRFDNEDILLDKANLRSLFGWGSWGRNRAFDPYSGADLSVTDGAWIIIFGSSGWVGYMSIFILACAPILILRRAVKRTKTEISLYTSTLCLILGMNLFDNIPNTSLNSVCFLLAGAILGRAIQISSLAKPPNQIHS